jgi:leucyl aminopeptidase
MKTTVSATAITHIDSDALILSVYPHPHRLGPVTASVDRELQGLISTLLERGDVRATHGEVTPLFPTSGIRAPRVLLVGLGDPAQLTGEGVRHAMAEAARRARDLGAKAIACAALGSSAATLSAAEATQATVEGARLGLYRYHREGGGDHGVEGLTLLVGSAAEVEVARDWARWGEATAAGVELARDLVNLPPNIATPSYLAEVATALANEHGFQVTIGDRRWIEAQQMGAFLGVTQGAGFEPRFIVLEHDPSQGKEAPLVLVGKGVTFDSGGISIKGRQGMEAMKSDMAGAAAVLGAMHTLGRLRSPRRVVALIPSSENMLDAHAYRPADVLTASNGLTIEIISTDAEGRLLLADALVFAQRYKPRAVVDLATLTGAVVVALGEGTAAGRFANDEQLATQLDAAAAASGERVWPLPLWPEYLDDLKSEVADMKNSSGQPRGGAPVAAAFLERFVDYPWTHLDIAGMALTSKTRGYRPKGATGYGVRLLVHWVTHA